MIIFFHKLSVYERIFNKLYCDTLREKCPNTELFQVRIFTLYLSVFRPNTGKYGPEITPYLDTFHAVINTAINTIKS